MKPTIQLSPFRLEPSEWSKLIFMLGFRPPFTRLLVAVIMVVVGCQALVPASFPYSIFGGLTFIGFLLLVRYAGLNTMARNPLNHTLWNSRQVEFDDYEFRTSSSDGTNSQIPFRNIVKCQEFRGYYLLYLTLYQFMAIPVSAFRAAADEAAFRENFVQLGLLKPRPSK